MNKSQLLERMEKLGVSPKRSLGQNFLISENVIEKIIATVGKKETEELFEIGPGLGSLTETLRTLPVQKFTVVELDESFARHWESEGLKVIEGDALQLDWASLSSSPDAVLVSNLPYQISASLVMELSSLEKPVFKSMVLMFQKEVAERITAKIKTKDFGVLSVVAQNRWKISKVVDAAPSCFHPRPQVASRVLQFELRPDGYGSLAFLKFVKAGFQNRRKMLVKSLKGIDASFDWEGALSSLGKSLMVRAEELTSEEWLKLYLEFKK